MTDDIVSDSGLKNQWQSILNAEYKKAYFSWEFYFCGPTINEDITLR